MIDIISDITPWVEAEKPFAIASVIHTWRSAPRLVGSAMAITTDNEIAGSVSGGCVEGSVIREAEEVLRTGISKRLSFGVSNDDAWSVGLSCGGKIEVYVERFLAFGEKAESDIWWALQEAVDSGSGCVLLSNMAPEKGHHLLVYSDGKSVGEGWDEDWVSLAKEAYTQHKSQILTHEGKEVFATVFPAKDRLLIIGAAHLTADLVELAHGFRFETTVIDPRGIFAEKMKFTQEPDQMLQKWPQEVIPNYKLDGDTYAVVLSHDPKIDDPALHLLLRSEVAYIGALGSRKTHAKRVGRLQEAGFSEEEIARIHAPVGLDMNARRPREIALSIMGEVIDVKNRFL
jgi:xanthine dehydrogenase accessory factor